jgi:hypothetical protein
LIRGATDVAPADHRNLAASLVPEIVAACDGRLGPVQWFRADWQRGGAATGTTTLSLPDGGSAPVLLKLPVVQRELLWTRRLQDQDDPDPVVPRLYASGETVGEYDLAWILIERLGHGPLGLHWSDEHVPRVAAAAARFAKAAQRFPLDQSTPTEPWATELEEAQRRVKVNRVANGKRWRTAIRALLKRTDRIVEQWRARPVEWLHGDMHLANAMMREPGDDAPVVLIDLAEVHVGHWVEEAVYLERQLWARPERLERHHPVRSLAQARKALELPVDPDYPRLASMRRALLAGTAPMYLKTEGHPKYLEACLARLEHSLTELK